MEIAEFKIIRAPFTGIVTARNIDIGDYIASGSGTQFFRMQQTEGKIVISRDRGSNLEISQGLSESDQIITSPPPGLVDGTVVIIAKPT
jgi:hypothetical protein